MKEYRFKLENFEDDELEELSNSLTRQVGETGEKFSEVPPHEEIQAEEVRKALEGREIDELTMLQGEDQSIYSWMEPGNPIYLVYAAEPEIIEPYISLGMPYEKRDLEE